MTVSNCCHLPLVFFQVTVYVILIQTILAHSYTASILCQILDYLTLKLDRGVIFHERKWKF